MHLNIRLLLLSLVLWCLLHTLVTTAAAGMLGYPVPRLRPLHARIELAGDSFQETMDGLDNAKATSGRGLLTVAFGPTDWSEIYARFGMAEFNVQTIEFNGDFGFAYGGGARLRLFRFSWGSGALIGQYLRFHSNDNNNPNRDGTWEEVDVGLGLGSRRFGAFQFYGGGVYHNTDITIRDKSARDTDEPQKRHPWAYFSGGEYLSPDRISRAESLSSMWKRVSLVRYRK